MTTSERARGTFPDYVTTLLNAAVAGAEEKIGRDTVVLDLRELVDSFDALVVTSGRNDRQVRAIAEEIERLVEIAVGAKPIHIEGMTAGEWVAMDYGDVIIHVFDEAARDYYDLEHLWNSAPSKRTLPSN